MPEYVRIKYSSRRAVYIDAQENGYTNEVLRIGTGTHLFHLGEPSDYRPKSQTVLVQDTTVLAPLVIEFSKEET